MRKKQKKDKQIKQERQERTEDIMNFKPTMSWQIVKLPDGSYKWILMPRSK